MTPFEIGLLGLALMLALMFLRLPIGFSMGLVGFVGIVFISGLDIAVKVVGLTAHSAIFNYTLSAVPLFILMGMLAAESGIATELYFAAQKWIGHLPGGLAMATVFGAGGFGAICGSSLATAATLGTVAYPEMKRHGYNKTLAVGCIAAGGTIGSMIPPSMMMVVIAYLTEQSAGKLLVAGFLPGILQVITYAFTIFVLAYFWPHVAPPAESSPWKARIASLKPVWPVVVIFLVVIGGIYAGIMTPTEGASIGAFCTFVLVLARRKLSWQNFRRILTDTTTTGATLLMILVGAITFNYFLTLTRLPAQLSSGLEALALPPFAILMVVCLLYLVLGMVMDTMAIVVLTLPILFPIVVDAGFNPIWFGVFTLRWTEIALITPPVGLNVFVLKGVVRDVATGDMFKGIIPFFLMDLVNVALLIAFPIIITLVPTLMSR